MKTIKIEEIKKWGTEINAIFACGTLVIVRTTGWLNDRCFCVKCNKMENLIYEYQLEDISNDIIEELKD